MKKLNEEGLDNKLALDVTYILHKTKQARSKEVVAEP